MAADFGVVARDRYVANRDAFAPRAATDNGVATETVQIAEGIYEYRTALGGGRDLRRDLLRA
jgi:hypothetical protein